MNKSESIKELATALSKMQGEMGAAKKGAANPFFKSKYADLAEIIEVSKEPLTNNGLAFSQFPISIDSKAGVETILMHSSGEWMSSECLLATSKQDPQAYGSAFTYARRYALQAILGIPSEDDDANAATNEHAPLQTKVRYPDESKKICECGGVINGNYAKCYTCNQLDRESAA